MATKSNPGSSTLHSTAIDNYKCSDGLEPQSWTPNHKNSSSSVHPTKSSHDFNSFRARESELHVCVKDLPHSKLSFGVSRAAQETMLYIVQARSAATPKNRTSHRSTATTEDSTTSSGQSDVGGARAAFAAAFAFAFASSEPLNFLTQAETRWDRPWHRRKEGGNLVRQSCSMHHKNELKMRPKQAGHLDVPLQCSMNWIRHPKLKQLSVTRKEMLSTISNRK